MAINDIFRLALIGVGPNSQQLVNVLFYKQITTVGQNNGTELGAAWLEDAAPAYQVCLSSAVSIVMLQIRGVTNPTLGVDITDGLPLAGLAGTPSSAPTAPAIITFTTGFIGRQFRGRNYLWPTLNTAIASGQISGGYAEDVAAYGEELQDVIDSVSGAQYNHVVYSRTYATDVPVLGYTPQQFPGRMGSRRPGVGV